jgi:hypothetical protein
MKATIQAGLLATAVFESRKRILPKQFSIRPLSAHSSILNSSPPGLDSSRWLDSDPREQRTDCVGGLLKVRFAKK